jgi:hypothetical protein
MTTNFLVTINTGPADVATNEPHPSFSRLCGLVDGHGIPATWLLDDKLMAHAVAGVSGGQTSGATDMVSVLMAMTTPQNLAFVDFDKGPSLDHKFDGPGSTHNLAQDQLRHLASGFGQVAKFRRRLQHAVGMSADFHLILDPGFTAGTDRSCAFLENILFTVSEYRSDGRIKFSTIEEIRRISADSRSERKETAA